jgi:hypothetical protein
MSCFAKYVAVAHVLRTGSGDICIYSDADILVLRELRDAIEDIGDKAILLTPHQLGPSTDSGEHQYLCHGWVNGGFFCIRREHDQTDRLLDWLIHRISRRGFHAPQYGLSGDQTWLSSLPFVFHDLTKVSQRHDLNVAYWNLEERKLDSGSAGTLVNGTPLSFFHFSGFDPKEPSLPSKNSDIKVSQVSALGDLCREYKQANDAMASLRARLGGLPVLECSKAPLQQRILLGSMKNGLNIAAPSIRPGLFTRVGHRIDFLLSRAIG